MENTAVRVLREPRVTLIARQQFIPPAHINWKSDSDVGAQAVTEFAGRLCFDAETEVLTRRGWRYLSEVDTSCEVFTKNPRTGEGAFQTPIAVHRYDYSGEMYCAEGRDVSFAVTPEHRQWGRFRHWKAGLGPYEFVRTDELKGRVFAIDAAVEGWSGSVPEAVELPETHYSQRLSNAVGTYGTRSSVRVADAVVGAERVAALARLCVFYATEGSLSRQVGTGQGIVIYGDHVASVVALCKTLGLAHSIWKDPRNGVPRISIGGGIQWRTYFETECGRGSANKRLPRWILDLPKEELAEIWRILVRTDGHIYESGRETLCTTSTELADQCQEILCKLGFKSSVRRQSPAQGTNYPIYCVSKKSSRPVLLNHKIPVVRTQYSGEVFCLTVPNGTLFVRRNGIPHFSGNCYLSFGADAGMEGGHKTIAGRTTNQDYLTNILKTKHGSVLEHAVWTLLLEGVSRSLTHELVRHRAGLGYSQLSQRYVDESDIAFVLPPELEDGSAAYKVWERSCSNALQSYRDLLREVTEQVGDDGPATMRKKRARQAARAVLPNAAETKIVVTGNARAWRHFVEMRGSPTADVEIRRLAVAVLRVLHEEAPNIFGDMRILPHEDGTEVVQTEFSKV